MVIMYSVLKKYVCVITKSLCDEGGENNDYRSSPPNCDICEIYLTRNDPPVKEKTYSRFRIKDGVEYGVE